MKKLLMTSVLSTGLVLGTVQPTWAMHHYRTAEEQARSQRDLLVYAALAGVGIIIMLSMVMQNYRNLLLVLANLPFALVGGVFVALTTGGNLSLGSLVGFVTLFGITLRNSIMLISHY